jgi:aspartate/glutamate racemase
MRTLGIVGGIAPGSTVDYYRLLIAVLAGTELPLLLRDTACAVPLLDTTRIHVSRAMTALLA